MTFDRKSYRQLSELLVDLLDGTISEESFAHLEKCLSEDAGALQYYVEFMATWAGMDQRVISPLAGSPEEIYEPDVDGSLWHALAQQEKTAAGVEAERADEIAERVLTEAEREAKIRAFIREEKAMEERERRLEEEARRKICERELRRRQRIDKIRTVAAKVRKYSRIGAMAAVGMVIAYFLHALLMPVPPASVATLTDGVNVKWANPEQPTELNSLLQPGTMRLVKGFAEITFDGGAKAIIEAPVEIELRNAAKAYLQSGKMSVTVPLEARGFAVNTPSASIVDLGTEFSVHVKEDGSSDIHVFKGQVSLMAGKFGRIVDKLGKRVTQIVRAGQARRVKAGSSKIRDIQFGETAFVRNMPSPYELAIRQSKPVAYWRFDEGSEKSDRSIQYFGNAAIEPVGPDLGDGKTNYGLKLDGKTGHVLAGDMAPNWAQSGFSLVLWVRPDAIARQNIIINADQDGPFANYSRQLFVNSEGKFAFWILVWEPGLGENEGDPVTLTGSTVAQPGKWHHVAVTVAANGDMRLFVNGTEEDNLSLIDLLLHVDPERDRIYIGSAACGELDDREPMHSFEGGLDEIARYNRVLSPKEIRQLYMSAGQ